MRRLATYAFTLIEMVVATLLLAIGVVGALSAFASATRASAMAHDIDTAALLAQRNLSELSLTNDTPATGDQSGDFGEDYPGFLWQRHVEATDRQRLFLVSLNVYWGGEVGGHHRTFVTNIRAGEAAPVQPPASRPRNRQSDASGGANGAP